MRAARGCACDGVRARGRVRCAVCGVDDGCARGCARVCVDACVSACGARECVQYASVRAVRVSACGARECVQCASVRAWEALG